MNKPSYGCSKCSRAFRRMWNAQRHNDTVHRGLSNIILINHGQQNKVIALKNQPGYHSSFVPSTKSQKFKYARLYTANDSTFKPFNDGSPLKKSNKAVRPMDYEEKEDFFYNTLEKMATPVENLEKLFFEKIYPHEPRENTQYMISLIIIASLADHDPIKYIQDKLAYHNRQYYASKVITYVAKYCRYDIFTAYCIFEKHAIGQIYVIVRNLSMLILQEYKYLL
jgi:hypothetical protein